MNPDDPLPEILDRLRRTLNEIDQLRLALKDVKEQIDALRPTPNEPQSPGPKEMRVE